MTISIWWHLLRLPCTPFVPAMALLANICVFPGHVCGEYVESSPPGAAVGFFQPGYISRIKVHGDPLAVESSRSNLVTVVLSTTDFIEIRRFDVTLDAEGVSTLPDYGVMFVPPVVISAYDEESSLNISVSAHEVSNILASSTCWKSGDNMIWSSCCFYAGPDLKGMNPACFDPIFRPDTCCVWKSPLEATVAVYRCSLSPWQDSWLELQKTIVDCSGRTSKLARECVRLMNHQLLSTEAEGCWIGQSILSLFLGLHDLGHFMHSSTQKHELYQLMSEARNLTHSPNLNMYDLGQLCLNWGFDRPQLSSCLARHRCSTVSPVDPIALAVCTMCIVVCADPVGVHASGWKEPMDKLVSTLYDMAIAAQLAVFDKGLQMDLSEEVVWVAQHASASSQMTKAFLE
eukprot:4042284-Amphidinium_carterae.1